MSEQVYHKVDNRHPEALELEELGLKWLAEPMDKGGVHVVRVAASGRGFLDTELIPSTAITSEAVRAFGQPWRLPTRAEPIGTGSPRWAIPAPDSWVAPA